METSVLENIVKESERIEEDALHSGKAHYNAASIWRKVHYFIGLPMTICAAWAGVDAFSDDPELSGYLSLLTAALAALQTFLAPGEQSAKHNNAGGEYFVLKNKVRLFREIQLPESDREEAVKEIKILSNNRNELNTISPPIPGFAYWLAKRGINKGENNYKVDKEN